MGKRHIVDNECEICVGVFTQESSAICRQYMIRIKINLQAKVFFRIQYNGTRGETTTYKRKLAYNRKERVQSVEQYEKSNRLLIPKLPIRHKINKYNRRFSHNCKTRVEQFL